MDSVWVETTTKLSFPALQGDITTDALIIGGGMCGILTAHKLSETGMRCVVVEATTIGSGITQNTTAKITAQHGLIYADLIKRFDAEKTKQYYSANSRAIQNYHKLSERFPCDFERKTAYVYSTDDIRKLEREAEAYQRLGLSANLVELPQLPIKTIGAIAMENQAQFHPLKLLYALADGLEIYENTFVSKIDGNTAYAANGKITAKHIVLATHFPMINIPGLYFLKLYQHRSYVLALENAPLIDGMYLDERESGNSFRTYCDLLFIGGGDHRTGEKGGGYAELEALTAHAYPDATVKYRWATQDCMSLDKIPYIGRHRAGKKNLYVATGFNKWGITGSMVAAEVLTDLVTSRKSEFEELYSPQRSMWSKQLFANIGSAAAGLLSLGGPRCTHMGCKLHCNSAEKSWDCSCHGSRYEENGHIINNPAKREKKL
ncbi:MAG: FAD-dependent oxidoreductase [Oscillospiraceae bacterium]|nr:FAD-dependent oxidoreductase [Oscillospiraceae bacterium]